MMILDVDPRPLTSFCRPYALAWAATHDCSATYDLRLIVYRCVVLDYRHLKAFHGLRLTTFVMRHSYGFSVRFRCLLSVFRGSSCYSCCIIAFYGLTIRYLWFPIGQMWPASMQGLRGGRMTSGVGVDTEYHHLVVQSCILGWWLCLCVSFVVAFFGHLFLVLSG